MLWRILTDLRRERIGMMFINIEAPRQKLGGMRRLAGVVLGKAALQVGRQADVALVGVAFALKEIDIEHVIPLGSPSFAKASEGTLLRATALQGLFCVARNAKQNGGWGGIRTHGALARTPGFKTGALNRSATHPGCACYPVRV